MSDKVLITKEEVTRSNQGWLDARERMVAVAKQDKITKKDLEKCVAIFKSACQVSTELFCEKVWAKDPDAPDRDKVCEKYCPDMVRPLCTKGGAPWLKQTTITWYRIKNYLAERSPHGKKERGRLESPGAYKYKLKDLRAQMLALEHIGFGGVTDEKYDDYEKSKN